MKKLCLLIIALSCLSALAAAQGGYDAVQHNVRLFMAPNMQHCGGGSGPNVFDTLSALEDWVEQGKAPDAIQARETRTIRRLDIGAWPDQGRTAHCASSEAKRLPDQ